MLTVSVSTLAHTTIPTARQWNIEVPPLENIYLNIPACSGQSFVTPTDGCKVQAAIRLGVAFATASVLLARSARSLTTLRPAERMRADGFITPA